MPFLANITQSTTLNTGATTAYDRLAYFALRSRPLLEMVADVRSTNQSHPGAQVQFTIYDDLARNITALTENEDVQPVPLSDNTVNVTLAEYGNAVVTSAKLRGQSYLNVDADAANIVGYNMGDSIDRLVHDVLTGGTNEHFAGDATSRATIDAADTLDAADVREVVANLRAANVAPWSGSNYCAMIHPDVSFDFRADTAVTDIIQFQIRQDAGAVRQGSIGTFGGAEFIETPRLGIGVRPVTEDTTWGNAGAGSLVDVYPTMVCGKQALAKAFSRAPGFGENPSIVMGPVTDVLRRFQPMGWYHLVGYGRFREASIRRIESASSIGANT